MPWAISAEAVPKTAFRAGVSLSALAYSFSALNALGIKRGNGSQSPWLSESLVVKIPGYPRKCQVIVSAEPCFVTSEVPMRFPELRFFCQKQKNEIYNLRVVPDLQISKKIVFV